MAVKQSRQDFLPECSNECTVEVAAMNSLTPRDFFRMGIGVLFLGAGLIHLTHADFFDQLVPAAMKDYAGMISTVTEALMFAMGLAFLVPRLRAFARWSAIVLLVATLPMAVDQVIHPATIESLGFTPTLAAARVLVQLLLIALIWWATHPRSQARDA